MTKKTATDERWKELGRRLAAVHDEIVRLECIAESIMPKQTVKDLNRAKKRLRGFRSDAEERMWESGGPRCTHVFYPDEGGPPENPRECPRCHKTGEPVDLGDGIQVICLADMEPKPETKETKMHGTCEQDRECSSCGQLICELCERDGECARCAAN